MNSASAWYSLIFKIIIALAILAAILGIIWIFINPSISGNGKGTNGSFSASGEITQINQDLKSVTVKLYSGQDLAKELAGQEAIFYLNSATVMSDSENKEINFESLKEKDLLDISGYLDNNKNYIIQILKTLSKENQ